MQKTYRYSQAQENAARRCVRGELQQQFVEALLRGESPHRLDYGLRGRAQQYRMKYANSTDSLIDRLRKCGLMITVTPGPRGGAGSATYHLEEEA